MLADTLHKKDIKRLYQESLGPATEGILTQEAACNPARNLHQCKSQQIPLLCTISVLY